MITKTIQIKGGIYAVEPDGRIRAVETHYGISADTKPTEGIRNADRYMEMDSGEVYLFDEENKKWWPV